MGLDVSTFALFCLWDMKVVSASLLSPQLTNEVGFGQDANRSHLWVRSHPCRGFLDERGVHFPYSF